MRNAILRKFKKYCDCPGRHIYGPVALHSLLPWFCPKLGQQLEMDINSDELQLVQFVLFPAMLSRDIDDVVSPLTKKPSTPTKGLFSSGITFVESC